MPPIVLNDPLYRRPPTPDEPVTVTQHQPPADSVVPEHRHDWAQIAYPQRGTIRVEAAGCSWLVPAWRAVWIPPGMAHTVTMLGQVSLFAIYIARSFAPLPPAACIVFEVLPLLDSLIGALGETAPSSADETTRRALMSRLLLTEVARAPTLSLGLPMPQDRRLQQLCSALIADPALPWGLAEWAIRVGASERTLIRLFQRELSMSFGAWRQQLRLATALDLIGRGRPVGLVAQELGYASQAAFSAMFKRAFGVPPGRFLVSRKSS